MDHLLTFILMYLLGLILGLIFFAGLWWTIQRGLNSTQPSLWFIMSMFLRTVTVLVGFYFVVQRGGGDLACCLAGFFLSSVIVTWSTRLPTQKQTSVLSEVQNAP
jgi:F1F0 ATPase subunit 2